MCLIVFVRLFVCVFLFVVDGVRSLLYVDFRFYVFLLFLVVCFCSLVVVFESIVGFVLFVVDCFVCVLFVFPKQPCAVRVPDVFSRRVYGLPPA